MAATNFADYDTAAIRAAARKLKNCARTLKDGASPQLTAIRGQIDPNLQGETGNALKARVNELSQDVNTIVGGINGLVRALEKYANELDAAALRVKAHI